MRWLAAVAVLVCAVPRPGLAEDCISAGCDCAGGGSVSFSCWDSQYNPDICRQMCEGSYATTGGGTPWWIDGLGRTIQGVVGDQHRVATIRAADLEADLDEVRSRPSDACMAALEQTEATLQEFAAEGEQKGYEFVQHDVERTLDRMDKAGRSPNAFERARDAFQKVSDAIQKSIQRLQMAGRCLESGSCSAKDLRAFGKEVKEFVVDLFAGDDDEGAMDAAKERVDEAQTFLEDYGERLTTAQMGNVAFGATCGSQR